MRGIEAKGDLEKAKELLRATEATPTEIARLTGCNYHTVLNWSKKLRPPKESTVHTRRMTDEERQKYFGPLKPPALPEFTPVPSEPVQEEVHLEYDGLVNMEFSKNNPTLEQLRAHFDYIVYLLGKSGASIKSVQTTLHLGG